MLEMIRFHDAVNEFASGRKSKRKARWKKSIDRKLCRKYMIIIY